jgi:hypothetical protein
LGAVQNLKRHFDNAAMFEVLTIQLVGIAPFIGLLFPRLTAGSAWLRHTGTLLRALRKRPKARQVTSI